MSSSGNIGTFIGRQRNFEREDESGREREIHRFKRAHSISIAAESDYECNGWKDRLKNRKRQLMRKAAARLPLINLARRSAAMS